MAAWGGAVVLSLLLAYATGGFWPKVAYEVAQPLVHYSGDALLVLEVRAEVLEQQRCVLACCSVCWSRRANVRPLLAPHCGVPLQGAAPGQEQVWSTSAALQAVLPGNRLSASVQVGWPLLPPAQRTRCDFSATFLSSRLLLLPEPVLCMQVGEEDANHDGKPDLIRFVLTAQSRVPVHSVKLLLQMSYSLQVCVQCVLLPAKPGCACSSTGSCSMSAARAETSESRARTHALLRRALQSCACMAWHMWRHRRPCLAAA